MKTNKKTLPITPDDGISFSGYKSEKDNKIHLPHFTMNNYWHPELFALTPIILYVCWILWKIYENTKCAP